MRMSTAVAVAAPETALDDRNSLVVAHIGPGQSIARRLSECRRRWIHNDLISAGWWPS